MRKEFGKLGKSLNRVRIPLNMKRLYIVLLFLYLVFLFLFNERIVQSLSVVNTLYFSRYLISLFPFILFTNLLLKSGFVSDFHRWCQKKNADLVFEIFSAFLIVLIGVPGNIQVIDSLKATGIIDEKGKENLLHSFGGISFPFIYLVILRDHPYRKEILFLFLAAEALYYCIFREKSPKKREFTYSEYPIPVIRRTGYSLFVILFSLLSFTSLGFLFDWVKEPFRYAINGLIEFSYNDIRLSQIRTGTSSLLLTFLLSFTSLSLIVQIKSVDPSFRIFKYVKARLCIALFSASCFFLLL